MNSLLIIEYLKKFFDSLRYSFICRIGTCQPECVCIQERMKYTARPLLYEVHLQYILSFFCLIFFFFFLLWNNSYSFHCNLAERVHLTSGKQCIPKC